MINDLECIKGVTEKNPTTASAPTSKEVTGHHRENEERRETGKDQRMLGVTSLIRSQVWQGSPLEI